MDLDTLWRVEDEFLRVPQWSTTVSPGKRNTKAGGVSSEPKSSSGGRTLQITDGNDSDRPSSMPALEECSDVSTESGAAMRGDESEAESLDSGDEESSDYDSEEEADLGRLERTAMDIASARPEIFEEAAFEELSNDNHFLKALGALRGKWCRYLMEIIIKCKSRPGRLFSSNPRLRTNRPGAQVAPTFSNLSTDGRGRDGTCNPSQIILTSCFLY